MPPTDFAPLMYKIGAENVYEDFKKIKSYLTANQPKG